MGTPQMPMRQQLDVLLAALLSLVAAAVFLGWRLSTPSECAWLPPRADAFSPAGVMPQVRDGCPLPAGSVVSDARVVDGQARYVVEPGGRIMSLEVAHDRLWLWPQVRPAAGSLLFVAALFALCGYGFSRRPHDPAAGSGLVYSSALLGSTVVTVVGLPPSAAFGGPARWLFAFAVGFVYTLAWGSMAAWAIQFPSPLARRLAGGRVRLAVTWLPALALAAIAVPTGGGQPYPGLMAVAIPIQTGITIVCLTATLTVVWLQMARGRRRGSDPVQRQQLVWLGASATITGLLALALWIVPSLITGSSLFPEEMIGLPGLVFVAGLGVSMLRYRLFELEVVLTRTLIYSALMLAAVVAYLTTVGVLADFVSDQSGGIPVIGAVTVAILVNPMRVWLERVVNRALYGNREDPYRSLSRVAELLSVREVVWDDVAHALRSALRVPFVSIATLATPVASSGRAPAEPDRLIVAPVEHAGESLGGLQVATRGRGERFTDAEQRLLLDVANQIGTALHEQALDRAVVESRERLILAREEERRMLRRAMHDDVGPTMAAIALRAETALNLLSGPGSTSDVADVLDRIQQDATRAADGLRRLAYDLRPPTLDELGLPQALRERFDGLPLAVHLGTEGIDRAGPLPSGVEAVAYRIVTAAVDNVVRHADAGTCWVVLDRTPEGVDILVSDDGVGPSEGMRAGVGLTAMRERAAELGGSCTLGPRPGGGTLVHAVLPLESRP